MLKGDFGLVDGLEPSETPETVGVSSSGDVGTGGEEAPTAGQGGRRRRLTTVASGVSHHDDVSSQTWLGGDVDGGDGEEGLVTPWIPCWALRRCLVPRCGSSASVFAIWIVGPWCCAASRLLDMCVLFACPG